MKKNVKKMIFSEEVVFRNTWNQRTNPSQHIWRVWDQNLGKKKILKFFPFWQSHLHIVVKFRGKLRLRFTGQLLAYVQGATISSGFEIGSFVGSLWFFKVLPNLLPYCPLKRLIWYSRLNIWKFENNSISKNREILLLT